MMRGSRDFATVAAYGQFLRKLVPSGNNPREATGNDCRQRKKCLTPNTGVLRIEPDGDECSSGFLRNY